MAKPDLEAAMGHRRPRKDLDAAVATTVFGDMAAPVQSATEIPISHIKPSPFQRRSKLDQEYLDSLKQTILDGGLVTPITVRMSDSDTFELVAGHHRVEAFRQLDMGLIPAFVRRLSDIEAARALTVDNAVHRQLTDYERYKHIVMLRESGACRTVTDLSEVLACSRAQVYNLEAFGLLPPEARAILEDGGRDIMGGSLAYMLREVAASHPAVVTEAVGLLGDGKLQQASVMLWIQNKISPPARTTQKSVKFRGAANQEVRLTIKAGEARIRSEDLNYEKLETLIRANLEDLLAD